eukprot:COSAG02_NODE_3493_length_6656_cov_26.298155_4_plen_171_part_00
MRCWDFHSCRETCLLPVIEDPVVVQQMSEVAKNDSEIASLQATSESMQAIIDAYVKANFLDAEGHKQPATHVSRDQVLEAVTKRYGVINNVAHRAYDEVIRALTKEKYTPVGMSFKAPRWKTELQQFHLDRIQAMKKPGFRPRKWVRRKKRLRLKSWRKWATTLEQQNQE